MKDITQAWLDAAKEDLIASRQLLVVEGLTNIVAFHSQQCIEKAFKAILEEQGIKLVKSHDLIRLCKDVERYLVIPNQDTLLILNELYVDSRYPGEMGLLPSGKPNEKEAKDLVEYSASIFDKIHEFLSTKS